MKLLLAMMLAVVFALSAATAQTLPNPLDYLAQASCPGGALPNTCARPTPLKSSDTLPYRRADWPPPSGYQIDDSVLLPSGQIVQTFSYPPFRAFVAANGDGGDLVEIDSDTVRIVETRDGGKPADQYFVGPACGGTGWVAFKTDVKVGTWSALVATLDDRRSPTACGRLKQARTRYKRETIPFPFIIDGRQQTIMVDTIMSEHYTGPTIAHAPAMERFFWGRGWGRIGWQAWIGPRTRKLWDIFRRPYNPPPDLAQRCPAGPWVVPPATGFRMVDCRLYTDVQPGDGWSVAKFGWPASAP